MKGILYESAERYGWNSLTDLELLTIVTGDTESASVLKNYLSEGICSVQGLLNLNIEGIGKSTAMKIKALYSLFSRPKTKDRVKVLSSLDLYNAIAPCFTDVYGECVYLMLITPSGYIEKKIMIAKGSLDCCLLDVRMVVKYALEYGCTRIALAHNHPGGSCRPSVADIKSTEEVKRGCQLMRIALLDHIIVGNDEYYSFSDEEESEN